MIKALHNTIQARQNHLLPGPAIIPEIEIHSDDFFRNNEVKIMTLAEKLVRPKPDQPELHAVTSISQCSS